MRGVTRGAAAVVLLAAAGGSRYCRAADLAYNSPAGDICAMSLGGSPVSIQTDLRVPLRGWRKIATQARWSVRDVRFRSDGDARIWTGRMLAGDESFRYEQVQSEEEGELGLSYTVTSESDAELEGVYLFVQLPVASFGGGTCQLVAGGTPSAGGELPPERSEARHLFFGNADTVKVLDAEGNVGVTARFNRVLPVTVQDNREWNTDTYSIFVRFHGGSLPKGQMARVNAAFRLTGRCEAGPAALSLDAGQKRYRIRGFGGNYCFGIESPVTDYTLSHLRVGCARTEMTLSEWEPRNDNDSPSETDWSYLESQVKPGSNLEREFRLHRRIQDEGIPYGISAWRMPRWLLPAGRGSIPRGKWGELLESVASYLLHAKRRHGAEPEWFSFNEADIGVDVKLSPEEHRDVIKLFGARFEELGLKTKMLLADVCNARGTVKYAEPTVRDATAMRYVNAVAFHSWGGASPEQYAQWGDLARDLGIPLYVAEVGVDAGAWRTSWYIDSFWYALQELRHYQEILLYARPQGTMQWEFTSDYGLVKIRDGKVETTPRFWFIKHFCDLTPPEADALATASDRDDVLFTAFVAEGERGAEYALHVANLGAEREARISGLPRGVSTLAVTRSSETESFRKLAPVRVLRGATKLRLAPQSITTLDTRLDRPRGRR